MKKGKRLRRFVESLKKLGRKILKGRRGKEDRKEKKDGSCTEM